MPQAVEAADAGGASAAVEASLGRACFARLVAPLTPFSQAEGHVDGGSAVGEEGQADGGSAVGEEGAPPSGGETTEAQCTVRCAAQLPLPPRAWVGRCARVVRWGD